MKESIKILILGLLFFSLFIGLIFYEVWQYRICREQVCKGNNCFWYCLQHISN